MATSQPKESVKNGVGLEAFHDFDPRVIFMIHDVDQSDETFEDIRVEIAVRGDGLTDEEAEVLTAGARRSPVWNLMRLEHELAPVVSVEPASPAAD